MKILLQPREYLRFGQDFNNAGLSHDCGLTTLSAHDGRYPQLGTDRIELVVSQNPDELEDSSFIGGLGGRVPVVVHAHYRWNYLNATQKDNASRSIRDAVIGIAPAAFLAREMQTLHPNVEWHAVANGVRTELFRPSTDQERTEFKRKHRIALDTKVVGIVGRLENAKGLQITERIASLSQHHGFSLFIQYPHWQAIREHQGDTYLKIARSLKWKSPQNVISWGDEAPRFPNRPISNFDMLVTPSLSEVQPLVVFEALACGIPVIATQSTPFFEELAQIVSDKGCEEIWNRTISIPPRFEFGEVAREKIDLNDPEIEQISEEILSDILAAPALNYAQRQSRSNKFLALEFTERTMNAKNCALYERAINNRSPERVRKTTGPLRIV